MENRSMKTEIQCLFLILFLLTSAFTLNAVSGEEIVGTRIEY